LTIKFTQRVPLRELPCIRITRAEQTKCYSTRSCICPTIRFSKNAPADLRRPKPSSSPNLTAPLLSRLGLGPIPDAEHLTLTSYTKIRCSPFETGFKLSPPSFTSYGRSSLYPE